MSSNDDKRMWLIYSIERYAYGISKDIYLKMKKLNIAI